MCKQQPWRPSPWYRISVALLAACCSRLAALVTREREAGRHAGTERAGEREREKREEKGGCRNNVICIDQSVWSNTCPEPSMPTSHYKTSPSSLPTPLPKEKPTTLLANTAFKQLLNSQGPYQPKERSCEPKKCVSLVTFSALQKPCFPCKYH